MRLFTVGAASGILLSLGTPAFSGPPAGSGQSTIEGTDICLLAFDKKARAKRLSPDLYKVAIEGACADEHRDTRGLYSLRLERDPDQQYLLSVFDQKWIDEKAKLVADYIMK